MTEIRSFSERFVQGAGDATIAVAEWSGSQGPLVCVHGLTSHSRAFAGLATELPDHHLVAVDCRGRGRSSKVEPFGMEQHAADLAAVLDGLEIDRATLVGHSMGAYVASAFNARYPERVERLVFVDGGYPMDFPVEITPADLLTQILGTFLTKMQRTWASPEEYFAFYENTPIYANGVDDYGRAHFAYDLTGEPPNLRARIAEECVVADWCDLLDRDIVGKRLEAIEAPLLLIRAPGGLTGAGDEVVPDDVRDAIISRVPQARVVDVPGTNHHTILFSLRGARAVARAIQEFTQ